MCVAGVRDIISEATAAASSSCFDALLASWGLVRVPSHQQQQQEMTTTHVPLQIQRAAAGPASWSRTNPTPIPSY